jgi:probable rRNA maturation factor
MAHEGRHGRALRVVVADENGRPVSVPGLASWLSRVAPDRARGYVAIALVRDSRIRALNKRYRKRNYATDVLSFPYETPRSRPVRPQYLQAVANRRSAASNRKSTGANPRSRIPNRRSRGSNPQSLIPNPYGYLGDIVIARGLARRQAHAAGHSERTELRILALHGLLHLLGYDHERDGGAMARFERTLRVRGGLREGLIEREAEP